MVVASAPYRNMQPRRVGDDQKHPLSFIPIKSNYPSAPSKEGPTEQYAQGEDLRGLLSSTPDGSHLRTLGHSTS